MNRGFSIVLGDIEDAFKQEDSCSAKLIVDTERMCNNVIFLKRGAEEGYKVSKKMWVGTFSQPLSPLTLSDACAQGG